ARQEGTGQLGAVGLEVFGADDLLDQALGYSQGAQGGGRRAVDLGAPLAHGDVVEPTQVGVREHVLGGAVVGVVDLLHVGHQGADLTDHGSEVGRVHIERRRGS